MGCESLGRIPTKEGTRIVSPNGFRWYENQNHHHDVNHWKGFKICCWKSVDLIPSMTWVLGVWNSLTFQISKPLLCSYPRQLGVSLCSWISQIADQPYAGEVQIKLVAFIKACKQRLNQWIARERVENEGNELMFMKHKENKCMIQGQT